MPSAPQPADLRGEHLLAVAEDPAFCSVFGRACDVSFEGDWSLCAVENIASATRVLPIAVVVHADEAHDRGRAAATALHADLKLGDTPVLVVGARIGLLDRWLLAAEGAFAVRVPVMSVEVLSAVISEALAYARSSREPADRSHPWSQVSIVTDALDRLPIEAFFVLVAAAWSGGVSLAHAAIAVADAAFESGHEGESLRDLELACQAPIPLVDVDVTELADADRWYLYAFAFWIALGPDDEPPRFSPALQVLGFTLGVSPRMRNALQSAVLAQRREHGARETFRQSDFRASILPELEESAGLSIVPPAPEPRVTLNAADDVLEMPDDAMVDDVG